MVASPSTSDDEQATSNLSKKELQEIERRRLKNKKKKESKKRREKERDSGVESQTEKEAETKVDSTETKDETVAEGEKPKEEKIEPADEDLGIEIEYVGQDPTIDENDPNFAHFRAVFNAFKVDDDSGIKKEDTAKPVKEIFRPSLDKLIPDEEKVDQSDKMSRRKLRLTLQPSIASLKESTVRPDVVEWADVTSRDPFLLVALKSLRNTVPVPRHWNSKRKYLAGKRGFERTPFQLPDFIKRTGIQDMRDALLEKEEHQSLKSKMRERTRPKLGKINIDYQKLHDAFFKWQTKPAMTTMGELYYEGKEQETLMRDKKPGQLSDELRIALGMPVGPTAFKFPPPWLIAMQRYGPPPSYPNMKIQGLSAPIPESCSFGYHAGGWGKPPVDDYGKPLYGDVFGVELVSQIEPEDESRIERRYWGEIGSDESSEEESEEEVEEEEEKVAGISTPMVADGGMVTPSGITTGMTGLETPETIELRKGRRDESIAGGETPAAAAYHIIPEKKVDRIGNQMMASTHVYDLSKKQAVRDDAVEVSLDPERIDLDQNNLQEYYDEGLRKQVRNEDTEDLSDMIADHNAKQNRKRKVQDQKKQKEQQSGSSSSKKYKDFKF